MSTILVIEDELEIAEAVRAILEDEGLNVKVCSTGTEAVDYLKRNAPDLVLSDVMMPGLSGYDVLAWAREDSRLANVPFVLMSAAGPSMKQTATGWSFFLKKPFTLERLLETVTKFLPATPGTVV